MINNIMVCDRYRYNEIIINSGSRSLSVLDFIVVREKEDRYTVVKNRENGMTAHGISEKELMQIAKNWKIK